MAEYLASIFGTEKDKVNCSFYFKIGACRHGDRCSRIHNKPTFSQTVLIQNLYHNPQNSAQSADGSHLLTTTTVGEEEIQEHFDNFFEDVFIELEDKYGEIEEMNVCDNLGDHLVGNVYVKFRREEDAEKAVADLNNRWFAGRPVYAELSPVTDFREACCRQYEMGHGHMRGTHYITFVLTLKSVILTTCVEFCTTMKKWYSPSKFPKFISFKFQKFR
ncbi:splicing factor U2af 38 kDa subunit-like isoform X3 [Limulus polyphemus]|uniref:Splicing factor U2af 38 kDa subunit-like isoform X3 n=1 Tax=Limulus polyphemus TaxID=6850 RepID=A0ABM1SR47_LIMPO|nr:splicing factor U2af 38 kDa subunit-like isoform X3 [Limulus polyphemus]